MTKPVLSMVLAAMLAACGAPEGASVADEEASESSAAPGIVPAKADGALRVATYNVSFYRDGEGEMLEALLSGEDEQVAAVAEVIRTVDPDVLLLQEIDWHRSARTVTAFCENYLATEGEACPYAHVYMPRVNTGVASGVDLDNDGEAVTEPGSRGYGNDAFGYGTYEGQYAMAVLSKLPIDRRGVRTFQTFLWKDMPGNVMPAGYYSNEAQAVFRLSSKTMMDVPVEWNGTRLHVIAAHPTPPSFDGPEDRNGRRNHDEIRLMADYVTPGEGDYIVDDEGVAGGLPAQEPFVLMGDLNADPNEGDSYDRAIWQLLDNPAITDPQPTSAGGAAAAEAQGGVNEGQVTPHRQDTADFRDDTETSVGNLRIDYVLPSTRGIEVAGSGIFWPAPGEAGYDLIGTGYPVISSDHRLVWVDMKTAEMQEE